MKLPRREFLHLAAGAAALPFAPHVARAQAYPSRPVKIVVGQAAGSATDIVVRLFGQFLSEKLGQQFIIEVRPGAAGNIATEAVTHMPPDGYSLLAVNSQNAINVALYEKLNFDFVRDIAPIALVETVPLIMEVHPSVVEFVARQGQSGQAQHGIGRHRRPAAYRRRTVQVHGRRGPRPHPLQGLDAGRHRSRRGPGAGDVRRHRHGVAAGQGGNDAGARRDDERAACVPAGRADHRQRAQGLRGAGWIGFGAPAATPPDIIATLNKLINTALGDPRIRQRLIELARRVCQIHQR